MGNDLSKLDPKLKEAYDRVMGTSITPPQAPKPESHEQTKPEPAPAPQQTATVNPPPQHSETSNATVAHKATKKRGISPLILAFLGLVFFVIYAAVWIKVLNFKVPFLNP